MRSAIGRAAALAIVGCCGALLAGCGSATKTVTVAGGPPAATTSSATTTTKAPAKTAPPATGTTPSPAETTRTASEPAFVEQSKSPGGAAAAAAVVRARGYTPHDLGEYHSDQTLRVLVGTRTGSGDGYGQRAFFFIDGRYLGTDTKEPSATLKVVSQSDTEVAISYPLYRHGDPLCCPGAGSRVVHFALNNGRLAALDSIPPAESKTAPSRL